MGFLHSQLMLNHELGKSIPIDKYKIFLLLFLRKLNGSLCKSRGCDKYSSRTALQCTYKIPNFGFAYSLLWSVAFRLHVNSIKSKSIL